MDRKIIDFKLDKCNEWTAILSCGHPQHTRHNPPLESRHWVLTQEGRSSMVGQFLNCVRCDEFEIPEGLEKFKVTPEFSEDTLPDGLKRDHKTSEGIWGIIVVQEGTLLYHVTISNIKMELSPEKSGIIVPELIHYVEPVRHVRFFIEFYRNIMTK